MFFPVGAEEKQKTCRDGKFWPAAVRRAQPDTPAERRIHAAVSLHHLTSCRINPAFLLKRCTGFVAVSRHAPVRRSGAGGVQPIRPMPLEPCIYNPLKRQPLFHVWSRKPRPISERASARRSGNKCGGRDDGFNAKNPTGHVVTFYDLTGLIGDFSAGSAMRKTKPARRICLQPLETGQIWRMAELNLRV